MGPYSTPGVYIEEIVKFPPSVAQVETAIPAFIGNTEKAIRKDLNSRSYISFVVEPDGSITNIKYVKGHRLFKQESIRVVKNMPKWNPGELEKVKVRTRCQLPIIYTLE